LRKKKQVLDPSTEGCAVIRNRRNYSYVGSTHMAKRKLANNTKKRTQGQRRKAHPGGYRPRGKKGEERARLAKALGAKSDRELLDQFPKNLHKPVTLILQGFLSAIAQTKTINDSKELTAFLKKLLDAIINSSKNNRHKKYSQEKSESNLRLLIAKEMANTLIDMPFIINDEDTSETEKLEKLEIYIEAMEDFHGLLDLEWIGEKNQSCKFDPLLFESKDISNKGANVVVRKPGLKQGDMILKKAIVEDKK